MIFRYLKDFILKRIGVNVRVPNIFKMTPEMMNNLTSSPAEDPSLELGDDPPPSGLSQTQVNSQNTSQVPLSTDPFSISKNRINGDVRYNSTNSVLFEKLNGSKVTITPIVVGDGLESQALDTPTAPERDSATEILPGREPKGTTATPISTEPPLAPMRKARTLQGLGMDFSVDAPPKMRSNTVRSKSRGKNDSEDTEMITTARPALNTGIGERKRTISGQIAPSASTSLNANITVNSNDPMAPQRRSVRLFNQIRPQSGKFASSTGNLGTKESRELRKAKTTGTKGRNANGFTVGRVVSGNRKHGDPMEIDSKEQRTISSSQSNIPPIKKYEDSEKVKEFQSLQWLLELFTKLGSGYFCLSHYQCQEALQIFNSIAPAQRETPWVLAQIGRALCEQSSYLEAEKCFIRLRIMAPARIEDMEVYSTVLWHLKKEVDLAFLAHELTDTDRDSPQAWCAVGNSFAIQRDHDQALKCFKRATQLDPKFAYAFTLQGHEHIANEEYDKAMAAYRSSLAAESRHYNAWYGIGKVFEKQGKYQFAEQHYRTAATINPTNAVIVCYIGVVLEKMKNHNAALAQYNRSCELAPKSALARFKRARVLLAMREPEQALEDLRVLKDTAPDDANVHFLLARTYKQLQQKGSAIKHFTTALNLDPKVCAALCRDTTMWKILADSSGNRHRNSSRKRWRRWKIISTTMTRAWGSNSLFAPPRLFLNDNTHPTSRFLLPSNDPLSSALFEAYTAAARNVATRPKSTATFNGERFGIFNASSMEN